MQHFYYKNRTFSYLLVASFFIVFVFGYQLFTGWPFIGKSYFLADQLDQILQLKYLLKGKWELLYGPYASGTNPPVYNFNGFTSLLFGIPALLGAEPFQIHLFHVLIYISCLIPLFFSVRKENKIVAYSMIVIFSLSPIYWWGLTMFWINIFLLSYSILHFTAIIHFLRKPSPASYCCILITWLLALGIHTSPIVNLPLIFVLTCFFVYKLIRKDITYSYLKVSVFALLMILLPYFFLELSSGFSNTYAILSHLSQSNDIEKNYFAGIKGAKSALDMLFRFVGVNFSLFSEKKTPQSFHDVLGWIVLLWVAFCWIRSLWRVFHGDRSPINFIWLYLPLLFIMQILYFLGANRPLLSIHYILFMVPYYAFIWGTLAGAITSRILAKDERAYAVVGILLIVFTNTGYLDKVDKPIWTYDSIKKSMLDICKVTNNFISIGKPGFQGYRPYYENLLEYVTNHHIDNCFAIQKNSKYIVVPDRRDNLDKTTMYKEKQYRLVRNYFPGIGLYVLQTSSYPANLLLLPREKENR